MPDLIDELVNEEKQEERKQKKKPRLKFRPKRKLDFDEDKEEYMPIPKDEPIDWKSLPLPDLNILITTKPK